MITAGLKVSFLGMSAVASFLLILILLINISYRILSAQSAKELEELEKAALKRQKKSVLESEGGTLVAVISAAIAAHRARSRRVAITRGKRTVNRGP